MNEGPGELRVPQALFYVIGNCADTPVSAFWSQNFIENLYKVRYIDKR